MRIIEMAFTERDRSKLVLAEKLLQSAQHTSEAEMRNSLSRIYYAVLHVAEAVTSVSGHGKMPAALTQLEAGLGDDFRRLRDLRVGADYTPNFVEREFGDLETFRSQFPIEMDTARTLYERLLKLGSGS
jgi:hypothetical protein